MAEIKDPENTLIMETTQGQVIIELLPDLAPGHVARIKATIEQVVAIFTSRANEQVRHMIAVGIASRERIPKEMAGFRVNDEMRGHLDGHIGSQDLFAAQDDGDTGLGTA